MQQIKIYKGVESELGTLERDINDWIRESGVRVIAITGNIAPQAAKPPAGPSGGLTSFAQSDILVIVTYESDR
jgi:hypothetical protein